MTKLQHTLLGVVIFIAGMCVDTLIMNHRVNIDLDKLYAQVRAEMNRANYWQREANEQSLEFATLKNRCEK